MYRKLRRKLSLLCCFAMAVIVMAIILCCLNISEKNMYGQEEAIFLLKANTIAYHLKTAESINIQWYRRNAAEPGNLLYLEVDHSPSALSSITLSDQELALVQDYKKDKEKQNSQAKTGQPYVAFTAGTRPFLVMEESISEKEPDIRYLYFYSLENFYQNRNLQRFRFGAIWLVSLFILYGFSQAFTAHALQPIIQNEENQKHFIAVASHELRSPLSVFKTGLSVLKNKPDTERSARIFTLMDNEMSRMERLIQDLLSLTKAGQPSMNYQFQPIRPGDLLEEIYQKYKKIAKEKQIALSLSKEGKRCCLCDPQRLEQLIIILLDNALSYTPAGQTVALRLFCSRNKCCIQVIDTGQGIPDQEKEKIFGRFYQVNASRSNKEHFGLGLSIAQEICHAHGGKITVSDTKGGGSTFTVRLPLSHK
ncbi:HAMP domain-containing histidine kinase [Petralouisia muris]|uniref:HAMP domain-containing histidine kinase n=1 Tax=Petralouisia muris TaxID=3032872 RepID=A0AC61S235_9FIRM|nr:HAMP domain-containing sensor histidine kinase [Petralouisia muris]TGY98376.1 HAMP domain-containing histidine kinase [Petralouisia muris]